MAENNARYGLEMNFWKKERINYQREEITRLLTMENPPEDIDWEEVLKDHLIKTSQFQHERLIHLMVTITFAICAMVVMGFAVITQKVALALLFVFIFLPLVPYIFYYFMLENNTQAMYPLYDGIMEKVKQQRRERERENDNR